MAEKPSNSRTEPTERTPEGLEVPIPTRREFFGNLKKVVEPKPQSESDEDSTTSGTED
jgi:hypothetical protein